MQIFSSKFVLGFFAGFLTVAAAWLVFELHNSNAHRQPVSKEKGLAELGGKLSKPESAALSNKESPAMGGNKSSLNTYSAGLIDEHNIILSRLQSLENRLTVLEQAEPSANVDLAVSEPSYVNKSLAEVLVETEQHSAEDAAFEIHERQSGQSNWGFQAANSVREAYAEEAFFREAGGQLDVDCRKDSCLLRWYLSDVTTQSGDAYDQLLSLAEYELTSLAAHTPNSVGRLQSQVVLDGPSPQILILFYRDDN